MATAPRSVEMKDRPAERTIPIEGPLDLRLTLSHLGHGAADPTFRVVDGAAWRATRTPTGPATVEIVRLPDAVRVRAWGPGAAWALAAAPELIGADDDPAALEPHHPLVRELARRMPGLRIGRTRAVFEALVPAILGQKVTSTEAGRAYRGLIRAFGEPAPGPVANDLRLLPSPETVARLPYHAFHPLGLEQRRAEMLIRVARVAARLEESVALAPSEAYRRLASVTGIGPWTAAKVGRTAFGDPDAVLVGDFHLPNAVCWALAGEPRGDDARMLELLGPYRGQRGRVIALIGAAGIHAPRYGPPMSPRRIEDW